VTHVLFVCTGNICRSPFAAAAMERALPAARRSPAEIRSAGFFGPGRPPPDAALAAALRRGIDLSAHRSRLVTEPLVRGSDCIFVMDPRQETELRNHVDGVRAPVLVLGDLDPADLAVRRIEDPYGKDERLFDAVYERIERCVQEVARLIPAGR
jgi:protein-tyrosine phosphatase